MRFIFIVVILFLNQISLASENHDEKSHDAPSSSVGADKGITEKNENGFRLSKEAIETFDFKMIDVKLPVLSLPSKALVLIKDEKFIYRWRDGWYKRIGIKTTKVEAETIAITVNDLKLGDKIIIQGAGFLRIAEIFSEEGAEHSHAH